MQLIETALPEVRLVRPLRHADARGWFSELYHRRRFAEAGLAFEPVQDNLARSHAPFTLRGLHFQIPPSAQAKLVRVLCGRILDVAVDLRPHAPTYRRHVAVELSAEDGDWLFVPKGFAHGYLTLSLGPVLFPSIATVSGMKMGVKMSSAGVMSMNVPITSRTATMASMMKIGCATTVSRKLRALRAVSQCWNRCGNMPTDRGIKQYEKNWACPSSPSRAREWRILER